jgi:hypothetical protein
MFFFFSKMLRLTSWFWKYPPSYFTFFPSVLPQLPRGSWRNHLQRRVQLCGGMEKRPLSRLRRIEVLQWGSLQGKEG